MSADATRSDGDLLTGPLAPYLEARERAAESTAGLSAGTYSALAACRSLSDALDRCLESIFVANPVPGVAVVAVGGYGRREQSRHSDIDVMLLVSEEKVSRPAADLLYPLWDSGLKVGHSIRTLSQAVEAAKELETLTALMDSRLVAGDADLFESFQRAFARFAARRRPQLVEGLRWQREQLVAREPWQMQEPNVKKSRGGLRSLQAVHWLNALDALVEGRREEPLTPELVDAKETLLATRQALHAQGDRPNDRYLRPLVGQVASWLGVDPLAWSRRLLAAMRLVDAAERARIGKAVAAPARSTGRRIMLWRRRGRQPPAGGVTGAAGGGARLSDLECLLAELRAAGKDSLEPLPRTEWLVRLLPEWEALRCLPHTVLFHHHPVDVHVWRTVWEVGEAMREDWEDTGTVEAAKRLPDPRHVLLAALLHDMGKGHEGDHSEVGAVIAERFSSRAGLDAESGWRLAEAVRLHLLIPNVATRRDIADAKVIREVAAAVRDTRMLHLLYILAVADSRACGPDVWNPWRGQLMRTLYLRVLDLLEAEQQEEETPASLRAQVAASLAERFGEADVLAHIDAMPVNYLLGTPGELIGDHMALIREANGGTAVRADRAGQVDRLTVVAPDRPGILALVAGTLAVHQINVLGGSAFTRRDGVAIQVFHVGDGLGHGIDERRWSRVLAALPEALTGRFPVEERLAETRRAYGVARRAPIATTVLVDNVASESHSIVEVNTFDRLGLLYSVTKALHGLGLDIHLAKVDTIGPEVVDAFYVRTEDGRRLEREAEIQRVRSAVLEAVETLDC